MVANLTAPYSQDSPTAWADGVHLAVYVHIPYCATRCSYCAFNTYTRRATEYTTYARALCREIECVASGRPRPSRAITLYFGGGTPSALAPEQIVSIIDTCRASLELEPQAEITLEANPGSVTGAYLTQIRASGVNRLSLGMQSSDSDELALFARRHSLDDVREAVTLARSAGIGSVNLDLIYGVPRQTMRHWQASVEAALSLQPNHMSIYSLGVEEGTAMARWIERGSLEPPDPDLAADMYEWASERFAVAGLLQYEISNWAAPGHACRHNVHVWRNLPYLGLGAGAHGGAGGVRTLNVLRPDEYIARCDQRRPGLPFPLSPAVQQVEPVSRADAMGEMMLLGLRLTREGVSPGEFRRRFGVELADVYGAELDHLHARGLVRTARDGRIVLAKRARLLGNLVFAEFV